MFKGRITGGSNMASGGTSPGTLFQEFETTGDTTVFTVTDFTLVAAKAKVYIGGILVYPKATAYSVSGQVVTMAVAVPAGNVVTITN